MPSLPSKSSKGLSSKAATASKATKPQHAQGAPQDAKHTRDAVARIERELMRGAGPVAVLKLLSSGPKYGYQLVEALGARTEGVLAMGQSTLYPMLYNLEAKGLIEAFWQEAPQGEGGRDRRYYRLTSAGKAQLQHDERQWQAVAQAMRGLGVLTSCRPAFVAQLLPG
jgi:PadR family transcriptional regulator PadR